MTSIQDKGRIGLSYYAIPNSGYMLPSKAELANFLVGNKKNDALLECTLIPPQLEFIDDNCLSITGDDFNFMVNDSKVSRNKTIYVKKGDTLKGSPQKNAHLAYIAFQGKLGGQKHYASQSTYANANLGGINGMFLKEGDIISIDNKNLSHVNRKIKENWTEVTKEIIQFHKGPEFKFLDNKSLSILFNSEYKISSSSNRMGARLEGSRLTTGAQCTSITWIYSTTSIRTTYYCSQRWTNNRWLSTYRLYKYTRFGKGCWYWKNDNFQTIIRFYKTTYLAISPNEPKYNDLRCNTNNK